MPEIKGFAAFPSRPGEIGETIESAVRLLRQRFRGFEIVSWTALDIPGQFIAPTVLESIDDSEFLIADITTLNFNVTFEIGYAIGRRKRIILVRSSALANNDDEIRQIGIFDTIGYAEYENSHQLADRIRAPHNRDPIPFAIELNTREPVYLTEAKFKTDPVTRIVSRIKKAGLIFRSFDPNETPRLSAHEAIRQVASSYGVLVYLVSDAVRDQYTHNLRAAFIAGLSMGMDKITSIVQQGDSPVPLDYRDAVNAFQHPGQLDDIIHDFAAEIFEEFQAGPEDIDSTAKGFLENVDLGASTAENELKHLATYYLQTDAFHKVLRGEARLVVGRKGSGKTAVFIQARDKIRRDKQNVVLDLKPDGYKLLKFKSDILDLLDEGSFEHTVAAIWEYILLLEITHRVLADDRKRYLRDHTLFDGYRKLVESYYVSEHHTEGDFSERLSFLLDRIASDYQKKLENNRGARLSNPEITELIFAHDVRELRTSLRAYLKNKSAVWLLIDNLDKGWPAKGIESIDLTILRTLLEATRKLERELQRDDVEVYTSVFLRNDVYELLVDSTPDRGKESKVLLDWTDKDLLKELLRLRVVSNFPEYEDSAFAEIWSQMCINLIRGEETSRFLIDRSLMRPRYLIDLVNHCRSVAVNLRHRKIEPDDIDKGLSAFSTDLVSDINYEIQDVKPEYSEPLYAFIEAPSEMAQDEVEKRLIAFGCRESDTNEIIDLLLWYGFLGVEINAEEPKYIFDVNYNYQLLRGLLKQQEQSMVVYSVNPAFWSGLYINH